MRAKRRRQGWRRSLRVADVGRLAISHESTCSFVPPQPTTDKQAVWSDGRAGAGGPSLSVVLVTLPTLHETNEGRCSVTKVVAHVRNWPQSRIRLKRMQNLKICYLFGIFRLMKFKACWTTETSFAVANLYRNPILLAEFTHPALSSSRAGSCGSAWPAGRCWRSPV